MEMRPKLLCPSILNLAIDNIREEVEKLDATDMDIYHVDLMDGTFVPNFGMSVRELEMIRRVTDRGYRQLIDCHMMVMNPHNYIEKVAQAGADIIYIHPESELIPSATLELIQMQGKKTGLILNPCTALERVKDMLPITDYVMIMAVNPGFAGREFMPCLQIRDLQAGNVCPIPVRSLLNSTATGRNMDLIITFCWMGEPQRRLSATCTITAEWRGLYWENRSCFSRRRIMRPA